MPSLTDLLTDFVRDAFRAAELPAEDADVTRSNRPDLGQFQSNGALAAAKRLKRNPRELAEWVRAALLERHGAALRDVALAGPGFINLSLTDEFLAAHLNRVAGDERLGVPAKPAQTVILDYGGPNVAKPMHVGHLRASIIGDALRRAVPLRRRPRARRRSSRRLGPAHGHDHRRDRPPPAGASLLRRRIHWPLSEREPSHARGPRGDIPGRRGRLQSRSGPPAGGADDHRRAAVRSPRIPGPVAALVDISIAAMRR